MPTVKTAELEGAQLDWAVAVAEGRLAEICHAGCITGDGVSRFATYRPSTRWNQGGPIIERELIELLFSESHGEWTAFVGAVWGCDHWPVGSDGEGNGPSPLIAAMRAFVASKMGEEVELP